jgi:hypothetical protein
MLYARAGLFLFKLISGASGGYKGVERAHFDFQELAFIQRVIKQQKLFVRQENLNNLSYLQTVVQELRYDRIVQTRG